MLRPSIVLEEAVAASVMRQSKGLSVHLWKRLCSIREQTVDEPCKTLDHACTRTGHVDTHEIMTVATIFGTLGEHHLMLALEIIAQRIRVMRDGRTVDPQQVGGMSFDHDDAPVAGTEALYLSNIARAVALLPAR